MTKVLYIEHDDDNLYMLKTRLERVGDFQVLAAQDSENGVETGIPKAEQMFPICPRKRTSDLRG